MTRLSDLRQRFPVADRAAHRRAYAEAERATRLGGAVHALRGEVGWTRADLAEHAGISEDAVVLAEEGDAAAAGGFAAVLAVLVRRLRDVSTGEGTRGEGTRGEGTRDGGGASRAVHPAGGGPDGSGRGGGSLG